MAVILVLLTFTTFLLIDYFYTRKHGLLQPAIRVAPAVMPRMASTVVAGFEVPANLRYHPGHTWALSESPTLVRVGMDDFASKLTGKVAEITLPQRGQWLRQGQKVCTLHRDGSTVEMLSPIEGVVANINDQLVQNPDLVGKDPYGDGWLVTVQAPDSKINFRNLLAGTMARSWMNESASRLRTMMPAMAGALAQDGGVAVGNLGDQIPNKDWATLTKEFFLS